MYRRGRWVEVVRQGLAGVGQVQFGPGRADCLKGSSEGGDAVQVALAVGAKRGHADFLVGRRLAPDEFEVLQRSDKLAPTLTGAACHGTTLPLRPSPQPSTLPAPARPRLISETRGSASPQLERRRNPSQTGRPS